MSLLDCLLIPFVLAVMVFTLNKPRPNISDEARDIIRVISVLGAILGLILLIATTLTRVKP